MKVFQLRIIHCLVKSRIVVMQFSVVRIPLHQAPVNVDINTQTILSTNKEIILTIGVLVIIHDNLGIGANKIMFSQ